jgi:DNA-binding LytR/AlgR family response regulator
MPTALICDDEPLMRANLREHLQVLWPELEVLGEACDGAEALRQIDTLQPELTFLDIQMPGLNGVQVAQLAGGRTRVVFVTAHERFALQAFEAEAADYLIKPLDPVRLGKSVARLKAALHPMPSARSADSPDTVARLEALLLKLQRQVPAGNAQPSELEWLQVDTGRELRLLHVDDVQYFEADHKYTRVVGEDCEGLIRLSLRELLNGLDGRHFQQVHRATVVNRRFIRSIHRQDGAMEIELRGCPTRLRVSESNQHLFRAM